MSLLVVSLTSDDVNCLTATVRGLFGPSLPTLGGELPGDFLKAHLETA